MEAPPTERPVPAETAAGGKRPAPPEGSWRGDPPSAAEHLRELRSRLPVSPLPWRWHRLWPRIALAGIVVAAATGAVASIVLEGDTSAPPREALRVEAPPQVLKLLGGMALEEKVDAVVVAGFEDPARAASRAPKSQLGGILVSSEGWPGAARAKELTARLRRAGSSSGRIPPLIVAHQEGGPYRSYRDLPPADGQSEAGAADSPKLTERWALQTARSLRSHGFDLNLGLVADVANLASPLAERVFGDDPGLVAQQTAAALHGCRRGGIACAVAHFPGLGGASADTATGPATVGLDPASLSLRDLVPFRAAIEEKVPAVVLSLAFYSGYDSVTPGALTPTVVDELLRRQLRFRGVAITDDLSSGAIRATYGAPQAAQAALAAGADLVVISDAVEAGRARASLLRAARSGALPEDRLDQAVARVLALKRKLGLV